jgi:hypothetical protein
MSNYRTKPARNAYWQAVQDERSAANAKLGNEMKAYNAARREWEANGKQGRQPSLKDFQTA